jgi:hypothetical protein
MSAVCDSIAGAGQPSGPAPAGGCSRAAYRNNNADPTAETAPSRVVGSISTEARSHRSGNMALATPAETASTHSSRPVTAPQAPNRGSDNSSNLRRPSAIRSTAEKTAPPRKPGIASAVGQTSTRDPIGSMNSSISTPMSAHPAAQVRPIPTAPRMRLSHYFITTSLCTWTFYHRCCPSSLTMSPRAPSRTTHVPFHVAGSAR